MSRLSVAGLACLTWILTAVPCAMAGQIGGVVTKLGDDNGPTDFIVFDDELYFVADGTNGRQLHRTDGLRIEEVTNRSRDGLSFGDRNQRYLPNMDYGVFDE